MPYPGTTGPLCTPSCSSLPYHSLSANPSGNLQRNRTIKSKKKSKLTRISQRNPRRVHIAKVPPQRRDHDKRQGRQSTEYAAKEYRGLLMRGPPQVPDRLAPEALWDAGHCGIGLGCWCVFGDRMDRGGFERRGKGVRCRGRAVVVVVRIAERALGGRKSG